MPTRRVAVTGIGVVTSAGIGAEDFWKGLTIEPAPGHREISGWDPETWLTKKDSRRLDRFSQFALVAAHEALTQAGELTAHPTRVSVAVATGIGGLTAVEELINVSKSEPDRASPILIPMMMANAASAGISIKYGFGGPATTQAVACAAGAQSISDSLRSIQWGYSDAAVAGGSEAVIRASAIAGFTAIRAMSPTRTARPFSVDRDGLVMGEGSAILVLEEWEMAKARGAEILAELTGAASTADAYHVTAPHPNGDGAERAIRLALQDAGIEPDAVKYINAHGTGTELNDRTEGAVIARVFGPHQPPVSSIKGATGHAMGASGAIEAAACVLAIQKQELPPTVGVTCQDPEIPLTNLITTARGWEPGPTLSNSFGFGGHNSVLVFSPAD